MVSANRLVAILTPVATLAAPRDAGKLALDSAFVSCHLSLAVYGPRKIMVSVCRGERLTRRDLMMDIAADSLFSDHGAPEYIAGRAGRILNS